MSTGAQGLQCIHCAATFPISRMDAGCPTCAGEGFASGVTPTYDYDRIRVELVGQNLEGPGQGIWKYDRLLPAGPENRVGLGEGGTPIIEMPKLATELDAEQVWIKDESRNPTWTFKDRNAAVMVSMAKQFGAETVVVSTSGNHGASVAAYAARAGLRCVALTYPGLTQATEQLIEAYGSELVVTEPGNRWLAMRRGIRDEGWFPASNFTDIPTNTAYGHEGYKTIAYELTEDLGFVPDIVSIPNAYGEGLFGIWKGFNEARLLNRTTSVPKMIAVEPTGGPLLKAMQSEGNGIASVPRTATIARGIGGSANSYAATVALKQSGGSVVQSSDTDLIAAVKRLCAEGIAVEPASAAALAGLQRLHREGRLEAGQRIVIVNTSSGLKNPAGLT